MIFSFLFKVILFYFLFIFIRGMFQTYTAYKQLKKRTENGTADSWENLRRGARPSSTRNPDVVEAEFRVLDKNS